MQTNWYRLFTNPKPYPRSPAEFLDFLGKVVYTSYQTVGTMNNLKGEKMEAMMKNLVVTEEIWKEGNMYTAYCPELDVASCGRDIEEARNNLLEVI